MLQDLIQEPFQSDRILIMTEMTWEDYEKLTHEDNSGYKISYFNNEITIVSPSRNHEKIAQIINLLVITYCRKYQISYFNLGSADIKKQLVAGKQPDASYCFRTEKDVPDLAIEVNYTSGSINDLEKYKLLNVPEVWIWQNDLITFYRLENGEYSSGLISQCLYNPNLQLNLALDSDFLNQYVNRGLVEDNLTIETDFFNALSC